jgi:hypothetical protein|tara:strand:- start:35 stop:220 length:186 start_codon:yes stop_codon:yes gene_type:complete
MFRKEGEIIMPQRLTGRKKITKMGETAQDNFIKHGIRNIDDLDKNSRTYRRLVKKGKNKSV